MTTRQSVVVIGLDVQGRVVIPTVLRRSIGLQPGDRLLARAENGRLILESADNAWKQVKQQVREKAGTFSLATELIAQRRQRAARE